ncbi:hypothetical protein GE09DRAFT_1077063 [Coniochaeta sp. 2T2.1]|nr:hypothetical protein GE09DRAFT_1077063 [Coniochaeta sp. 2T2.1]
MVFCGKPSRACGRCRSRRLKCDKGAPFCSACLRAGVDSCEYRDPLKLTFRDQNEKVKRKSQDQKARKQPAVLPNVLERCSSSPQPRPCQAMTLPTCQVARGYMYANYMVGGYLPCLVSLMERWPDSALQSAVTAVGLAALANMGQSRQVMAEAKQEYTSAICMIGNALNDSLECKRDDVLAAVVLLSMFEVMTCTDASSIRRWMGHVDGATRIVEVRGAEQLDSPVGLELFRHLRVGICLSGIYRQSPSSPMLAYLTEKAEHRSPAGGQTADNLATVILRLNGFCASLKEGDLAKPSYIISEALKLDTDLVTSLLDIPDASSYTTIKSAHPGDGVTRPICGNNYHIYSSISASSTWSNYRSARIFLREVIINALQGAEGEDAAQHNDALITESRSIGKQLVEEVCASVLWHIDPHLQLIQLPSDSTASDTSAGQSLPQTSANTTGTGRAITLMWPLLIAANSGFATVEQRAWITNCLDKIGHGMGIGQAKAMAQLLRDGRKTTAWLTTDDQPEEGCL